jgi:hypothetical protein
VCLAFLAQAVLINLFPAVLTTKFYRTVKIYEAKMDKKKAKQGGGGARRKMLDEEQVWSFTGVAHASEVHKGLRCTRISRER